MIQRVKHFYEFGQFRVEEGERLLLRNGEPVPLAPKVFDTLLALVKDRGHVIEKERLMKELWPDTFVEDSNLTYNISQLRKALGDGCAEERYIETVPRRGYRFTSPVREADEESVTLVEERSRVRAVIEEEIGENVMAPSASSKRCFIGLITPNPCDKIAEVRAPCATILGVVSRSPKGAVRKLSGICEGAYDPTGQALLRVRSVSHR